VNNFIIFFSIWAVP